MHNINWLIKMYNNIKYNKKKSSIKYVRVHFIECAPGHK